jgi:regulator of replication initiation timing
MATTRDALTAKIRRLNEMIDRLQAKISAAKSERNGLIAERDALTIEDEAKLASLQTAGVVRVED